MDSGFCPVLIISQSKGVIRTVTECNMLGCFAILVSFHIGDIGYCIEYIIAMDPGFC